MYAGWWDKRPVSVEMELRGDSVIDDILVTRAMPDLKGWWNVANDAVQNFRSALDNFHYAVCEHFTEPGWEGFVYFPITSNSNEWRKWQKQHKSIVPREVQPRYLEFQPWLSGRPHLAHLSRIAKLEKHRTGVAATVSLVDLSISGTWELEGTWQEEGVHLEPGSATFDLVSERQLLSTITLANPVLNLGDATVTAEFTFEPVMRFDGLELSMMLSLEQIEREVRWAIAHISGLVDSRTEPLPRIDL